jgi:PAS domain S-box-containing protein
VKVAAKTKTELTKEIDQLRTQLRETEKELFAVSKSQDKSSGLTGRLILDQTADLTIVCDQYGRISSASEVTHRYIGGRFLRRPFDEVIRLRFSSQTSLRAEDFSISKVLSGKTFKKEEVILQRDGEGFHLLLSARPLTDRHGKVRGCVVTLTDITERQRAEEAAKTSEKRAYDHSARLQTVLDTVPAIIWIAGDRECREITGNHASYVFLRVTEGTDMSKSGRTPERLAHYRVFKDGVELTAREMPIQRVAASGQGLSDYTMELVFDDGTMRSLVGNISPMFDPAGHPNGAIAAFIDITSHREAEMKYSKILAIALSGFWISDRQGRLLEVNEALCRMLGYTREELLTLSIKDVEANESPAGVLNHIAALQQKKSDYFVTRHRRKDGSIIDVQVNSTWLDTGEGQLVGFIQDITERRRAEQALRAGLERYRSYIEVTGELGWTTNADGEVVEDIPSFRKFTGQTYEEVKGWGWSRALHPDDLERTVQIWRQAVKSAGPYEVEYRLRRHDGIYRYFLARGTPVFNDNGSIREWVGICIDITERKGMEEELVKSRDELEIRVQERTKEVREQSRVLDSFFKFSITPFVILDKNFNFIRVNEAYAKACDREVFEFPGHNHFEFYPSDAKAKFEQVVQTRKPFVAIARPFSFPDHPEWGTTYWDWILTPLLDNTGEVEYLVFSLEDVTKRKHAEEALKAAHQYNRSLIEASLDPLVTIDLEGKVMDVNSATELVTGVPRDQLIGSDFSDYFTEPEKARKGYRTVFLKGTVRDYPLAIRHKSGMITDVLYNATLYRNEAGKIQGVFAAARDITERKRTEEALMESEARLRALSSQLLTAQENERKRIALELHDGIGQMLTAIKFKAENILQANEKTKAKDKSLEAVISLIKDTIEEVRRMQMDLRPSTLDDLGVLATLGWFCREYQKIYSSIRIEKEIAIQESEVSTPLKVVLYRLMQEAMNNIAKHSQADLIRLSLRKQENKIEWTIEDNGIGFDLEDILSSKGSKRGMGLSSMRERTQLSGGTFRIESTRGKGTTIRAIWPLS